MNCVEIHAEELAVYKYRQSMHINHLFLLHGVLCTNSTIVNAMRGGLWQNKKWIFITSCFQFPSGFTLCTFLRIPRLHYQPVSSRFSSCALTSPVSTSVCVYITTARTGLNQRQLVRLFHSSVAGSRAVPKHVRACR